MIEAYNIDVNERHPFGWTPLMLAAVNGRASVVKLLIAAGADPNAQDKFSNINRMSREKGLHAMEGNIKMMWPS